MPVSASSYFRLSHKSLGCLPRSGFYSKNEIKHCENSWLKTSQCHCNIFAWRTIKFPSFQILNWIWNGNVFYAKNRKKIFTLSKLLKFMEHKNNVFVVALIHLSRQLCTCYKPRLCDVSSLPFSRKNYLLAYGHYINVMVCFVRVYNLKIW